MKITCVGGGPAGLMLAIQAARDGHEVTVVERQRPAESFGFGVVFSDSLLMQLDRHDADTAALVREHAYTWNDQVVEVERESVTVPGHGYSLRRRLLLELLRSRATAVGVRIEDRDCSAGDLDLGSADLVVGADGVDSRLRRDRPGFGTRLDRRHNYFLWLGTDREYDAFSYPFVRRPQGWLWAHAYRYDAGASTFVVELGPQTWRDLGFDRRGAGETLAMLEDFFGATLRGHRLSPEAGTEDRLAWANFVVVRNRSWRVGNLVLLGDAAHTTHFTNGSGTGLAIGDALVLAESLGAEPDVDAALSRYQRIRQAALRGVQRQATRSARWYEQVPRYADRSPASFARLMHDRRSPVLPILPVPLYVALSGAADRAPAVAAPLRRLVSRF